MPVLQYLLSVPMCYTALAQRRPLMQVEDWETGEAVSIPLDPRAPAADTASALYKAAKKQDRTEDAILPILQVQYLLCQLHPKKSSG